MLEIHLNLQADSHASRLALFAQDAIDAAHKTVANEDDPSLGNVNIRVGIASGPVSIVDNLFVLSYDNIR